MPQCCILCTLPILLILVETFSNTSWLFLYYCNCDLWKKLWWLHSLNFFVVCCLASKICNLIIIQLSFTVLGDHMLFSEKDWWAACQTILWPPCIHLVARCSKHSRINLLWYIRDLLKMTGGSENLPWLIYSPKNQPESSYARGNVRSVCVCVYVIFPHMQSRGGSCSELSCLRSQDFCLSPLITRELINPGACFTCLFSPRNCWEIYIYIYIYIYIKVV